MVISEIFKTYDLVCKEQQYIPSYMISTTRGLGNRITESDVSLSEKDLGLTDLLHEDHFIRKLLWSTP